MISVLPKSRKFTKEQVDTLISGKIPDGMTRKQAFTFFRTHGIEPTIEQHKPDLWTKEEVELLKNNILPKGRSLRSAYTKAHHLGISFCPKGSPCPQLNLPKEKREEIARHAEMCRNKTLTSRKFGVSRNYVIQVCHEFGVEIEKRPHDRLGEHFEYEGNNYSWNGGSWICTSSKVRATGEFNLSKILYKKYHGEYPGQGFVIVYKDGNRYNLTKDNLVKMSRSEAQKLRMEDEMVRASVIASGAMGLLQNKVSEIFDPSKTEKRIKKAVETRMKLHPDIVKKAWETRRKRAAERGFFYTKETRQKMSESRKRFVENQKQKEMA